MVSYSLEMMNTDHLDKFKEIMKFADENGYPFYILTASSSEVVEDWEAQYITGAQFCHADERTLKTMVRANPGLILIKEGTVVNKWDDSKVPSSEEVFSKDPKSGKGIGLLVTALLFFVPLLFLKLADKKK